MPRKKLSEFRAKTIIRSTLGLDYVGYSIDVESPLPKQLKAMSALDRFALKVDQGVKGRAKKGLVVLDVTREQLPAAVKRLHTKGYRWLIAEPMIPHEQSAERYLSITQDRRGISLTFSSYGGVDVESHPEALKTVTIRDETDWPELSRQTGLSEEQLRKLVDSLEENYMVFLEINPYLLTSSGLRLLDLAVEVDDAGAYFVDTWHDTDFRRAGNHKLTPQEQTIAELDESSPASLKLEVINPNGSIFVLLSGGGASILVADEIYNHGAGSRLANYGEYSGNPTTEETYLYTSAVFELLLASKAHKKVLFIGGAVANFTDVANTFTGIIQALDKFGERLRKQHVKVYVRRGGPRQEIGLANMKTALEKHNLLGAVHGPEMPLPEAVTEMLKEAQ